MSICSTFHNYLLGDMSQSALLMTLLVFHNHWNRWQSLSFTAPSVFSQEKKNVKMVIWCFVRQQFHKIKPNRYWSNLTLYYQNFKQFYILFIILQLDRVITDIKYSRQRNLHILKSRICIIVRNKVFSTAKQKNVSLQISYIIEVFWQLIIKNISFYAGTF